MKIQAIPALKDNYIWALSNAKHEALIVDPGEAGVVLAFLETAGLHLSAILITHRHWDHSNGIQGLLDAFPGAFVYGPVTDELPLLTHSVQEAEPIRIADFPELEVLAIPGHTKEHVAYLVAGALFCGDTLFSAGCGRVFDGSYEQLYASLQKLAKLAPDTQIYCGHEYTRANLKFAKQLEPTNLMIQMRIKQVEALAQQGLPTLPSSIKLEQETNPFLRVEVAEVQSSLRQYLSVEPKNAFESFKALRLWKNQF